jgi:hypothetical protein
MELARVVGPEEATASREEALAAISQLDSLNAAFMACNVSRLLPEESRSTWAKCATEATQRVEPNTEESALAMSEVVSKYREYAPFAFAVACLRVVKLLPDEKSAWIYRNLISGRAEVATLAAGTALARFRRMGAGLRVPVVEALRRRFPYLLLPFFPTLTVDLEALEANETNLWAIVNLARGCRGTQRRRLLEQAATLFVSLINEPQAAKALRPLFASQYNPLRNLYEESDTAIRDKIRNVIAECGDKERRLYYKICLFPALAEAERLELGPELLREINPPPARPVVAGVSAEQQFAQVLVLFLHSRGNARTKSLLAMARFGAHMSRGRWLYDLGRIPSVWPVDMRARVSAPLLKAVRDATHLWP